MKIVIASDSYKGSCTTVEVADAIEKGVRRVYPDADVVKIPVADGGEGTVDALVLGTGGQYCEVEVMGPLGQKVMAKYGLIKNNVAVIEMAAASGLTLVEPAERNPLVATTFGTGQLIKAALDQGCKKILVGIGGSATNDGGAGMAKALGVSLKDNKGQEIGFGGGQLNQLEQIDLSNRDARIKDTEIIVLSDVTNPLCGPTGASYIYGPQKGATPDQVEQLDDCLTHYGQMIKEQLGKDVLQVPGAGAAGGLGAGLLAFCDAQMTPGIKQVLDMGDIDTHLQGADLVITGEGRIDGQTVNGKVPVGVAARAAKHNVPVLAIVGSVGAGASDVYSHGVAAIMDIIDRPMTLEEAIYGAPQLVEQAAENALRLVKAFKKVCT